MDNQHGILKFVLFGTVCSALFGCLGSINSGTPVAMDVKARGVDSDNEIVSFDEQGWTHQEASWFYDISQGSRIIPYDWMAHLEDTDGKKFITKLDGFGYIGRKQTKSNPLGLPVGFAKDVAKERSWVGLTCAACHTTLIEHKDKSYLVDGGPSNADFAAFMNALVLALENTISNQEFFDRFARSVLGESASAPERGKLKVALKKTIDKREGYNKRNLPKNKKHEFGNGRIDAFGAIFNEVTVRFVGVDENVRDANAPVSYPFLWDTPQHDVVQWNGSAPNSNFGDLARNVGEVLGVFGDLEIPDSAPLAGYASTVRVNNLRKIEKQISQLKSPLWPKEFSKIDNAMKERGRKHYQELCASCHSLDFDRNSDSRKIVADMQDVGTDPLMAENFRNRTGKTGKLFDTRINFNPLGPKFDKTASGETLLVHSVVGTILGSWKKAPEGALDQVKLRKAILKSDGPNKYKGRPLNGIWATGPFLHNGSVPTIRDLLKPAADRPKTFWVGNREFNIKDIGFKSVKENGFFFDTSTPGNENIGHEYGVGIAKDDGGDGVELSKTEIEELLEFIRSQ